MSTSLAPGSSAGGEADTRCSAGGAGADAVADSDWSVGLPVEVGCSPMLVDEKRRREELASHSAKPPASRKQAPKQFSQFRPIRALSSC
jgi:hypothetical protein